MYGTMKRCHFVSGNFCDAGSKIQQNLTNVFVAFTAGQVKRCLSRAIFDIDVDTGLIQKNFNDFVISSARCKVQRQASIVIPAHWIGPAGQQHVDYSRKAIKPKIQTERLWKSVWRAINATTCFSLLFFYPS